MPGSVAFQNQREFRCGHCSGKILVPKDLPPMTGPCPHCGTTITSPGPEDDKPPVQQQVSAKVEVPAVVVKEKVEVPVPVPVAVPAPQEPSRPAPAPPPLPPSIRAAAPVPTPPVEEKPVVARKVEEPAPVVPAPKPAPVAPAAAPTPEPVAPPPGPKAEVPAPAPVEVQVPPPPEPVVVKAPDPEPAPPPAPPPQRVVVPIGLSPTPPPPKEAIPSVQAEPVAKKPEPAPERLVVPTPPPPAVERVQPSVAEPVVARPSETPPAPQRVVVPIGLHESIPAAPAAAVVPSPEIAGPPLPRQVEPVPAALMAEVAPVAVYQPRIEEMPRPPAPGPRPAAAKISIGLTDEAMASVQPSQAPPAPGPVQATGQPGGTVPAPAVPVSPGDYTAAPDILRDREKPKKAKNTSKPRKSILLPMLLLLFLVLGGGAAALYWMTTQMGGKGEGSTVAVNPAVQAKIRESQYSQTGWQEEARQTLSSFLTASTPAGKAAFSIRGSELLPVMNEFYGSGPIDDSDTPIAGFATANLPPDDHKRGIFRMVYDQPPQFEMREFFRPLAPIEVQFGLQEPDLLLSSLARASNFSSDPVRVEVFFKREADGLKIDWETFVQTKYRTFRSFTEMADPGRSGIFRLFVMEDVPERGRASQGIKTYRLADPAHKTDAVRVEVPVDSELGKSLSLLNWRGVKDAKRETKTVTLELEWTREASPRLAVKKFICWEFLGIGGQAVNAPPAGGGQR